MSKLLCPVCKMDVSENPFKSWKYKNFEVKRYECRKCKSKFNVYQSPNRTYTIPKSE